MEKLFPVGNEICRVAEALQQHKKNKSESLAISIYFVRFSFRLLKNVQETEWRKVLLDCQKVFFILHFNREHFELC